MTMPSHILHVITAFDRGGAENHVADLVRHQRRTGMEVSIAYLRGRGSLAKPMRQLGARIFDLALRFYGDLRPLLRLRRLITRGSFQLVHAHLPPAELYARLALLGTRAAAVPLVISKHNDCSFHRLPGELAMERWVARRASAMIVISDAVRRYMSARRVAASDNLETIRYGVDVTPFDGVSPHEVVALRREWGCANETLVIGFAGRLVEQKSIETLIAAFALFLRKQPCNTKLVIVGDGPLRQTLHRCATEAGVAQHVVWTGFREDIPVVMRAFNIFALTSIYEGFGLVLAEAMAAGLPVVATRVSAIPEVVQDGETGLLADPRSPESVADALAQVARTSVAARMGAAGYRRAVEHFTLERMWRSTDAVYARALRSMPSLDASPADLAPATTS